MTQLHKVFVSYHHANDQSYRETFEQLFANSGTVISRSVRDGDIPDGLKTETVRQKIRDKYLRDSSVTVVLIGSQTWQRKHVDWEIASSLRKTASNPRSGLLGIVLPSYPRYWSQLFDKSTIPPRIADNLENGYAEVIPWTADSREIRRAVHGAFVRRNEVLPDNSRPMFGRNWTGDRWTD